MKVTRFVFLVAVCLTVSVCFLGTAFGEEQVRGVTKDTIRIGASLPLTKFNPNGGRQASEAIKAYANHVNDSGGINGRKIVVIIDDSQQDPSISLGIFKKQVTSDNIFTHFTFSAMAAASLIKPAMDEKVPLLISAAVKPFFVPAKKYVFCFSTPFELQSAAIVKYIHDTLKKKDARIAVFWRNDDLGKTILVGAKEAAAYYKYSIVAEPSYIFGQTIDFSGEVMKIRKANADYVIVGATVGDVSSFLREAKNQGLKIPIFGGASPASERRIVFQSEDAAENYFSAFGTRMFRETNIPGVKKMIDIAKKYAPPDILTEESFYYSIIYDHFQYAVEALKHAGASPTADSYVKALETSPYTGEGLGPEIKFSSTKHYSSDGTFLGKADLKIKDYQAITPWFAVPQDLRDKILK